MTHHSMAARTLAAVLLAVAALTASATIPDSVYVRTIPSAKGEGLFIEWSGDGNLWTRATQGRLIGSDYGPWGAEKKMYNPTLAKGADGTLALAFQLNSRVNQFGIASTRDLIHWRPQDYPKMRGVEQVLDPVITFSAGQYHVSFHNAAGQYYLTTSSDLVHFTDPVKAHSQESARPVRVAYRDIVNLRNHQTAAGAKSGRENELARDDAQRFAGLKDVRAEVTIHGEQTKAISDKLIGIFFEDINYSADGGLNAQLLQNGDFEYNGEQKGWNAQTAWTVVEGKADVVEGITKNNPHALALTDGALRNDGFDGIPVRAGEKYNFAMRVRGMKGGKHVVSLIDEQGATIASATVSAKGGEWKEVKAVLKPNKTVAKAALLIKPAQAGTYAFDMVSLLPQDTYKGHGLRRDLCETLEALHPRFMRFPGGCVAHGQGLANIYHWKETIGRLEDRKPQFNIWHYHQSRQMGYYEFFQMCEDMQMEPLPVVSAGVPCQNSAGGQQGGLPWAKDVPADDTLTYTMERYAQDLLDLIEWANGDATTMWGARRAQAGHKAPFNLHYLGIGNEDLISPTFEERCLYLAKTVHDRYPDIEICGTVGPFHSGSDYEEGWRFATEHKDAIHMVDEHYYVSPGWYLHNQDFYDHYDRTAPKVYLGEYASHGPGRKSTVETAVTCAMHICSLERNGDVVAMSSYAPLLAREGHTQWNPDLIYFNATEVHPTVDYYAQMMCGQSQGDEYCASTITTAEQRAGVKERLAVSTVRDTKTGTVYVKLVNMLPTEVSTHLNITGLDAARLAGDLPTTVLTGAYNSTQARPAETTTRLSSDGLITLPAYSFTVIRL